jgi:UDP-N-acetylmuramate dehydrogenase
MQNIGAYGMEVADRIHSITYWHRDGRTIIMTCDECQFGYRDSIFKTTLTNQGIIASVTFTLPKYNAHTYTPLTDYRDIQQFITHHQLDISTLTPRAIADIISTIRTSKLPDRKTIGTA